MRRPKNQIALDPGGSEVTCTRTGISCLIDRFIPPFTEITVAVSLPGESELSCKGVVITCDREGKKGYRLVLYFLDMDEEAGQKLARYCPPHSS